MNDPLFYNPNNTGLGEKRNACRILVGKPEGKKPLGRPRRKKIKLNSHSGRWGPSWVHSARRPLNGLLYLPRVIMMMENLVETEVLGENLPPATLSTTNPTWPDPGSNPGRRGGKPATNCLSYGAAPK
jgi:hypothetical protein